MVDINFSSAELEVMKNSICASDEITNSILEKIESAIPRAKRLEVIMPRKHELLIKRKEQGLTREESAEYDSLEEEIEETLMGGGYGTPHDWVWQSYQVAMHNLYKQAESHKLTPEEIAERNANAERILKEVLEHKTETPDDFKRDLKKLLQEYNASIGFGADDDSDWHGIHGEHLYLQMNGKKTILCKQMNLNQYDL